MGRGALRGAMAAWLGLVTLQAVATKGGSGRLAGLLGDVNRLVERVLDPRVPAIPDRRAAGTAPAADGTAKADAKNARAAALGYPTRIPVP